MIISCYCNSYIKSCVLSFVSFIAIQYDISLPEDIIINDIQQAKKIIENFPKDLQNHFITLFDLLKKKNHKEIIKYIEDNNNDLSLTIPKFDSIIFILL